MRTTGARKGTNTNRARGDARAPSGPLVGLMAALTALLLAVPATAQEQPAPERPTIDVSEEELVAFTKAHLQVVEIQTDLEEKMQEAETAEEAQVWQTTANQQMISVIQEEGLTRDRFVAIVEAINQDPQLAQQFEQIRERLEEEGGSQPGTAG